MDEVRYTQIGDGLSSRTAQSAFLMKMSISHIREQQRKVANTGKGRDGILGRMRFILKMARKRSRRVGIQPIITTAEKLALCWEQQEGRCLACGASLDLLLAHSDHDHKTGFFRGFIHRNCNIAEGIIKGLSDAEFLCWASYVRPKLNLIRRK
jgi:hypothetical protein